MCKNMLTVMMQENAAYRIKRPERETIHSGHFMVSYFDAEEQDDEYEVAVPVPEVSLKKVEIPFRANSRSSESIEDNKSQIMSVSIETSLTKLFQCMSIAYRQKLTSPKWNRFKGVRLRWKDKIRLNNVIWRCWHMQFVIKKNTGVCQFACPLDVDIHNKPEAVVLEGKYWKRKLNAVTAEYKKWRLFYRNQLLSPTKDDLNTFAVLPEDWNTNVLSNDSDMMVDEDYMEFMSDTLFTTISGNQFAFPDSRELARGTNLADLIQPSLVQLQPNLDFMDTLEPLHDLLGSTSKLPSVPEEYHPSDDLYHSLNLNYHDVSSAASSFGVPSGHLVTDGGGGGGGDGGSTDDHYIKDDPDNNNSPHQLSPINSTKNSYQTPHTDFNPYRNSTTSASSTLPSTPYISHHHPQYTSSNTSTSSTCNTVGNVLDNSANNNNSDSNGNNNSTTTANNNGAANSNDGNNYSCYTRSNSSSLNYSATATEDSANYVINYSQNIRHPTTLQQPQQTPHTIPINFSTSTMHSNSGGAQFLQCYSTEQTIPPPPLPAAYPPPINNYRCPTPSPSATGFPLKHTRSNSLVKNEMPITILSSTDKTYPNQKQLSQHGRSRSGSSLLMSQNKADTQCQNIQESVPPSALLTQLLTTNSDRSYVTTYPCQVQRQYPQHRSVNSCNNINCDPRNNFLITGHRPVAYCTALIGRRSRTPDHILSGNANPVGYCKPRPPLLSSQCDDLINLSNRLYTTHENVHNSGENFHQVQDPRAAHHSTPSRKLPPQLDYSNLNKNQYQPTTQPTYQPVNPSNASSYTQPFIFTATHNNPHLEMANQLANASNNMSSPKNSISPVNSESLSPLTVTNSPIRTTPPSPSTIKSSVSTNTSSGPTHYKEHRRVCHINAEQKRRCNIKNGFDTLHLLIPHLIQNPNTKMSKAAMLQKGAEYIRQLRDERSQLQEDIESLKQQIESLNSAISNCQSLLPATGAPVSRHRATKMKEMFQEYVKERTKQNWKFWILSLICEPLLSSFNASVSTASVEELFRTTIQWAEQYCSLVDLRPIVLNALRQLCTTTEILSEPSRLPEEVQAVVLSTNNEKK